MNEIIKPHSFEEAIDHIQEFSEKTPDNLDLNKVKDAEGLFGWWNHKVSGEELNNVITQIQGFLIRYNDLHIEFIKEFGQVYKALESLDKEYIPAILSAIKGAEAASEKANNAQADINKAIDALQKIVDVLEKHKEKLDELEHLNNIDDLWKETMELKDELKVIKNDLDQIKSGFVVVEDNNQYVSLKRKILCSYFVAGSALIIGVMEFIYLLIK